MEGILRRWSFVGETVLPNEPAAFYRVSVRCGFASSYAFRAAIASYRQGLRAVYQRYLKLGSSFRAKAKRPAGLA